MTRVALLLAGGAGTRLWPVSSDERPKQFIHLFEGKSLLRRTWERVSDLVVYVSTNERYADMVRAELPELPGDRIITEPQRRNTAPALALCCFEIAQRHGEGTAIAVLPSDHFIEDAAAFQSALDRAFEVAESSEALVTMAIPPTEPNTGYGYLQLGDPLQPGVVAVKRFVEKPDRARAEAFLSEGGYGWNSGMFVWRVSVFRHELARVAPEVAAVTRERYASAPSISIDHALMEHASRVVAVDGNFGWSDVGTWTAVARLASRGSAQLTTEAAEAIYAHSESGRRIIAVGVNNLAIVESPEGILVLDLGRPDLLSAAVKKLS